MSNDTDQQGASQTETPTEPNVLQLPLRATCIDEPSEWFDEEPLPCSTHYASIFYCTAQQAFWLLPSRAAEMINEAIHSLHGQISADKPAAERKQGLDQCGLLDYFLEPHLANFLEGEDKARLQEIERDEPYIENPSFALRRKDAAEQTGTWVEPPVLDDRGQASAQQDQWRAGHEAHQAMLKLNHEWQSLRKKAIAQAERQGYTYEAGHLFQPEALEARERVQDYLEKREAVLSRGISSISDEDLALLLAEDKTQFEQAMDCRVECESALISYIGWRMGQRSKQAFADYREAIIKVADYGLAVPEFALLPSQGSPVINGIDRFKEYLALESRQRSLNEAIRKKYQGWIEATGHNAAAPVGLVDQERAVWNELQERKKAMQALAQANIAQSYPRRHLLWAPEAFTPKPVERLVKADFPLREMSMPDTPDRPLSYLSLLNLDDIGGKLQGSFDASLQKAREEQRVIPENSTGKASTDSATSEFHQWLAREGAKRIDDQDGDWFDGEGWFDIERFHTSLQQRRYRVEQLQHPARRDEWGKRLRQVVFQDSVRRHLRLFDRRPQAQLVRCLAPPQPSIHGSATLAGPNFTLSKGFGSSAKVTFDLDLARGEVELLKLDLPSRETARPLMVNYRNHRDEICQLNLGRFSLHLSARAWGYTGASLLLSSELEFSHENVRVGNNLKPIEHATRPANDQAPASNTYKAQTTLKTAPLAHGATASLKVDKGTSTRFNVFAGTQAGVKITGALNWAPPPEVFRLPQTISEKDALNAPGNWLSLARLTGELGVAYGIGAGAEFGLSLHEGKLILTLKASLISGPGALGSFKFEVGYEAFASIHELFRRELHRNNNQPLKWVDQSAADFLSKMTVLGVLGLDPTMIYLLAYDKFLSLYEALSQGGRGGPIANTIVHFPDQQALRSWIIEAPAHALGPLFHVLTSTPSAFEALTGSYTDEAKHIVDRTDCHYLQQQAISKIVTWIAQAEHHKEQNATLFIESCQRMSKYGFDPENLGQSYCTNKFRLDTFMREPVKRLFDTRSDSTREKYFNATNLLGERMSKHCNTTYFNKNSENPAGFSAYAN